MPIKYFRKMILLPSDVWPYERRRLGFVVVSKKLGFSFQSRNFLFLFHRLLKFTDLPNLFIHPFDTALYTYSCAYIHIRYLCAHTHTHTHTHIHTYKYAHSTSLYTHMCHILTRTYLYIYTYSHVHTCIIASKYAHSDIDEHIASQILNTHIVKTWNFPFFHW